MLAEAILLVANVAVRGNTNDLVVDPIFMKLLILALCCIFLLCGVFLAFDAFIPKSRPVSFFFLLIEFTVGATISGLAYFLVRVIREDGKNKRSDE